MSIQTHTVPSKPSQRVNSYQLVTDAIISKLELGTVPWRRPWCQTGLGDARNLDSLKPYKGINAMLTACQGYDSPYWLTENQAKSFGAIVKDEARGKGTPIVYYSKFTKEHTDAATGLTEDRSIGFLKHFIVYNVEQIDGLKQSPSLLYPSRQRNDIFESIDKCEAILAAIPAPPRIMHNESRAYYSPILDYINMPKKQTFNSAEHYYATLWHEMGHASGHKERLNRKTLVDYNPFGSHNYSKEELVAEMTSAFLCKESHIDAITLDSSASYIAGWLKVLKGDSKLVVSAASQAQKAADYILNRKG